ncbi:MAG: hypothetical protein ACT4O1_15945 [Gemmatimonadota bacterium]
MFRPNSRREGFAIVGAVLAMLVVGVVVTGGFYAANQQSQVVRSGYLGDLAQYIAETGLDATVGRTTASTLDGLAMNATGTIFSNVSVSWGGRVVGRYTSTITRTTSSLYIVQSTGTVAIGGPNSGATRTVAQIIRLRTADFDNETAMQVFGDLEVTGTSKINGNDTNLPGWPGCERKGGTAAITAQPTSNITRSGSGNISGGPIRQDEVMDSTDFTVFGDLTWDDMVAMATNVYAPGVTLSQIAPNCTPSNCSAGGVCNTNVQNNWGAPKASSTHPCFNHFPIIWAQGDLTINANSSGQGILLVEGNLDIMGQFEFYGPIVVRGTVFFRGGSQVFGSVFAFGGGVIGLDNRTAGNMTVEYSSCAIERAVLGAAGLSRGVAIKNRSWYDLTTVQNSY